MNNTADNNEYSYTHKGVTYYFPNFSDLKIGTLRKASHAENELQEAFIILEETLGINSKELAMVDDLTKEEFSKFVTGWTQGVSLGE